MADGNILNGLPGQTNYGKVDLLYKLNPVAGVHIGKEVKDKDGRILLLGKNGTADANSKLVPDNSLLKNGVNRQGVVAEAADVVSKIAARTNNLVGDYSAVIDVVNKMTGGKVSLPELSTNAKVAKLLNGVNTASSIVGIFSSNNATSVQHTLTSSVNPQPEAFHWVETESEPRDYVSYDSVLIFAGEPLYADNPKGSFFTPIGLCETFTMSNAINVTSIQELRCEEQLILPGKTQPINVSMSRMCGRWDNLMSKLHINKNMAGWNYSMQYKNMRSLFGLYLMVLDTSRRSVIKEMYLERCAITSWNLGISAGNYQVLEHVSMLAGRVIDPGHELSNIQQEVLEEQRKQLDIEYKDENTGEVYKKDANGERYKINPSNGDKEYLDNKRVVHPNGDITLPDGTKYIQANVPAYENTKQYRDYTKARNELVSVQTDLDIYTNQRQIANDNKVFYSGDMTSKEYRTATKEYAKADKKVNELNTKKLAAENKYNTTREEYKTEINRINGDNIQKYIFNGEEILSF